MFFAVIIIGICIEKKHVYVYVMIGETADILDDQSVLLLEALIMDYWFTGSSQLDSYRPPGDKEIIFSDV